MKHLAWIVRHPVYAYRWHVVQCGDRLRAVLGDAHTEQKGTGQ